jgi:hypothetical protein
MSTYSHLWEKIAKIRARLHDLVPSVDTSSFGSAWQSTGEIRTLLGAWARLEEEEEAAPLDGDTGEMPMTAAVADTRPKESDEVREAVRLSQSSPLSPLPSQIVLAVPPTCEYCGWPLMQSRPCARDHAPLTPIPLMPDKISVNGIKTDGGLVELWGIATRQPDGTYRCFANVAGSLCRVELKISRELPHPVPPSHHELAQLKEDAYYEARGAAVEEHPIGGGKPAA